MQPWLCHRSHRNTKEARKITEHSAFRVLPQRVKNVSWNHNKKISLLTLNEDFDDPNYENWDFMTSPSLTTIATRILMSSHMKGDYDGPQCRIWRPSSQQWLWGSCQRQFWWPWPLCQWWFWWHACQWECRWHPMWMVILMPVPSTLPYLNVSGVLGWCLVTPFFANGEFYDPHTMPRIIWNRSLLPCIGTSIFLSWY